MFTRDAGGSTMGSRKLTRASAASDVHQLDLSFLVLVKDQQILGSCSPLRSSRMRVAPRLPTIVTRPALP